MTHHSPAAAVSTPQTGTEIPNPRLEVRRMLAEEADFVIGGDTHRDQHSLAVVRAATGGVTYSRSMRIPSLRWNMPAR